MASSVRWAIALSFCLIGCGEAPAPPLPHLDSSLQATTAPSPPPQQVQAAQVGVLAVTQGPWNADGRFIAFTACRPKDEGHSGSLFLWDDALKDIYLLNAALAGLKPGSKTVDGLATCLELEQLNPWIFAPGKILLSFGHAVYVFDMLTEERILGVNDGQSPANGGPRATITGDGKQIAYISNKGTLVLKPVDPVYATKTRELTKIAAEANALANRYDENGTILDAALSGDGHWLVVNVNGLLYLYNVDNPHLSQLLPLSGSALVGERDGVGHIAISFDGRLTAVTVGSADLHHDRDFRLLVFDRQSGRFDTVPYANRGDTVSGSEFGTLILNPRFCHDGRGLLFETAVGAPAPGYGYALARDFRVWRYDLQNETLRSLVILNNALGENDTQVLTSSRTLN